MDPKTPIKPAIQIPQREETFPVQEQELVPDDGAQRSPSKR